MVVPVQIAGRFTGPGHPCLIVGELGVNHDGRTERAHALIDLVADAGADAAKVQAFSAEGLASREAKLTSDQIRGLGSTESPHALLKRLELPRGDFLGLKNHCLDRGLLFIASVFDETSADWLGEVGVDAWKIPSGEITNLPLLAHVGRKQKPVILSTGMSWLSEVDAAVRSLQAAGVGNPILLHCVSCYPAHAEDANLRAIPSMARAFDLSVGYSDHTLGSEVALAAVALGASMIEKHVTLDRTLPGPDHHASVEPVEFQHLCRGIRRIESALGNGRKAPVSRELETARMVRKSLAAAVHIPAGTTLERGMITALRPGTGIPPEFASQCVGRAARADIAMGTVLRWDMLA